LGTLVKSTEASKKKRRPTIIGSQKTEIPRYSEQKKKRGRNEIDSLRIRNEGVVGARAVGGDSPEGKPRK